MLCLTGAWIVTGGTNAGVMEFVGEAVRDHMLTTTEQQVVALGVATWGIIDNKDSLISDDVSCYNTVKYACKGLRIIVHH